MRMQLQQYVSSYIMFCPLHCDLNFYPMFFDNNKLLLLNWGKTNKLRSPKILRYEVIYVLLLGFSIESNIFKSMERKFAKPCFVIPISQTSNISSYCFFTRCTIESIQENQFHIHTYVFSICTYLGCWLQFHESIKIRFWL